MQHVSEGMYLQTTQPSPQRNFHRRIFTSNSYSWNCPSSEIVACESVAPIYLSKPRSSQHGD
jgi:hypothetical protein